MRSRSEIEEYVAESNAENNGNDTVALLQLEVLLDIRDLLTDPVITVEKVNPE